MTTSQSIQLPGASIVTPNKTQRGLSLNRAAASVQQTATAPQERVFRCLSNNASANPISPELKHSFQPPASELRQRFPAATYLPQSPPKRIVLTPQQFAYYGARLDRTKLFQMQLRCGRPCASDDKAKSEEALVQDSLFSSSPSSVARKVTFEPIVTVVQIPSHRDYSERTKRSMWGSMKEIKQNALRNTAEFIHDKCDWRTCLEENKFYLDSRNGTLVHPVHVQRYYALWQQKKKKQEKERLRKEQNQELQDENQSDENKNHREQGPKKQERSAEKVKEMEALSCRKRLRCCSPSPIRRPHNDNSENQYANTEHQPKRRCMQGPVPCRPVYCPQTSSQHTYFQPTYHQHQHPTTVMLQRPGRFPVMTCPEIF